MFAPPKISNKISNSNIDDKLIKTKKKKKKKKKTKKSQKEKKPMPNGYMYFLKEKRDEITRNLKLINRNITVRDVTKKCGEIWNAMSDNDKDPYNNKCELEKSKFKALKKEQTVNSKIDITDEKLNTIPYTSIKQIEMAIEDPELNLNDEVPTPDIRKRIKRKNIRDTTKERMLLEKQNYKCRGPSFNESLGHCCPFKSKFQNGSLRYILGLYPYDIDHITELENGGTNNFDNLQILCKTCHHVKTTITSLIKSDDSIKRDNEIMNIYKALCKPW